MTHISQEGGLQTVAFLSFVPSCHQRALQFLTLIDTLGGTHNLRRLTIGITVDDSSVALLPMGDTHSLVHHLILLMVDVRPSLNDILEGIIHTLYVTRGNESQHILKALICGWHEIIHTITVVFLKNKRTSFGIITPYSNLHGLKDKVVLDVTSSDLVEFLQFTLQPFPCTLLDKNRYYQENQHQHSEAPLQDNDPCAF